MNASVWMLLIGSIPISSKLIFSFNDVNNLGSITLIKAIHSEHIQCAREHSTSVYVRGMSKVDLQLILSFTNLFALYMTFYACSNKWHHFCGLLECIGYRVLNSIQFFYSLNDGFEKEANILPHPGVLTILKTFPHSSHCSMFKR